jgi:hypothetical protein
MTTRIGAMVSIAVGVLLAATAAFGVASVVGQSASDAQPVSEQLIDYGDVSEA